MAVIVKVEINCPACGSVQESLYPLTKDKPLYLQCARCNKTTVKICLKEEHHVLSFFS